MSFFAGVLVSQGSWDSARTHHWQGNVHRRRKVFFCLQKARGSCPTYTNHKQTADHFPKVSTSKKCYFHKRQPTTVSFPNVNKQLTLCRMDMGQEPFKRPNDWRLRIRPTTPRDNGTYLCQISTHPPTLLVTHLQVIGKWRDARRDGRRTWQKQQLD